VKAGEAAFPQRGFSAGLANEGPALVAVPGSNGCGVDFMKAMLRLQLSREDEEMVARKGDDAMTALAHQVVLFAAAPYRLIGHAFARKQCPAHQMRGFQDLQGAVWAACKTDKMRRR